MSPSHNGLVVVAGATGYLGRYLVAELHKQGYKVRALVRSVSRAKRPGSHGAPAISHKADMWKIDFSDTDAVHGVLDEADYLISALGVTSQTADPWDIDFKANLALLEEAERARLSSMMYVGAIGIERGASAVQQAKYAFAEVLKRSPLASQVIHPSGYFSDLGNILTMVSRGFAVNIAGSDCKLNPIHGADLAAYCVNKLTETGQWQVGGPEVLSHTQIIN